MIYNNGYILVYKMKIEDMNEILCKYTNLKELKKEQFEIIKILLEKQDVLGLLQTGFGKSMIYIMIYLITKQNILIISPLLSLMDDQSQQLTKWNISNLCLNSNNKNKGNDINELINTKETKIIYTTPEFITTSKDILSKLNLALIVIDECHCVSAWGNDFRPEYAQLTFIKQILSNIPFLCLTATATKKISEDIFRSLNLTNVKIIRGDLYRPNLYIEVIKREKKDKFSNQLNNILLKHVNKKILIYCLRIADVDKIELLIKSFNIECYGYYASKSQKEKSDIQQKFISGEVKCVVSTIAFSLGININDIDVLINYDCPPDIESYYQQIGRAGRNGLQSYCYLFWSNQDFIIHDVFYKKNSDEEFKKYKKKCSNDIRNFINIKTCRHQYIVSYFDETFDKLFCNNCDNCLVKYEYTRDFTNEFQILMKVLMNYTTNYGSKHIIDDIYTTFKTYSYDWWYEFIQYLIFKNILEYIYSTDNYKLIKYTQLAYQLYNDNTQLNIKIDQKFNDMDKSEHKLI